MREQDTDGMNYYATFIEVAPDCPVSRGTVPVARGEHQTVPQLQYELLSQEPYRYTQEEVLFETHVRHKEIPKRQLAEHRDQLWAELFGKPQPCLRASMLPKKYGWGIHFDEKGKTALVPVESEEYRRFASGEEGEVTLFKAMRNRRG
jgi:hypothetical protein